MTDFCIRPLNFEDKTWVSELMIEHWGADLVVAHGTTYQPSTLSGFAAIQADKVLGLLTYHLRRGESCEIVTLDSLRESTGIGTALIEAVKQIAQKAHCKRLWLITTNDNLKALRFYQKRGFVLVTIHRNAIEKARKVKPEIPLIGNDGIPLQDEIELEMILE
jgi:ribosomal protein S18 acetylase RimI-like enzyme